MTPKEWLKHGVQIAAFVNERALRSDIISFIGEGAGQGHAACFCPLTAEIELDVKIAFTPNVQPAWVGNMTERDTLFEWPKAAGALIHEASHARWTTWDLGKNDQLKRSSPKGALLGELIEMFEEPRIEHFAVETWPDDKAFLRSSAMGIVMDGVDLDELKTGHPYPVSTLMLLTLARRDGGVLEDEDVEDLEAMYVERFGRELIDRFQDLWLRAFKVTGDPEQIHDGLLFLAEEWLKLLPEVEEELSAAMAAFLAELEELLENATASAELGGNEDAGEQQELEAWQAHVSEEAKANQEKREHERKATEVFGKGTADIPDRQTNSKVTSKRPPKPAEHAAAVILARELERARYRDRVRIETQSVIPPGRLHTRDALEGLAQRERGQTVTATPWRRVQRRHTEDPNLTIGVMVDISGSMRRAMEPMAVTAWVLAEAGYRIQATVAQVHYGNSAFPTLMPGTRPSEIKVRSAADGTERFNDAFRALDGKLGLLHGSGARLLVICSDTCYTYGEVQAFEKWTARCVAAGVGVIVMTYNGHGADLDAHVVPNQVQRILDPLPPVEAAKAIGAAAVKALEMASAGR